MTTQNNVISSYKDPNYTPDWDKRDWGRPIFRALDNKNSKIVAKFDFRYHGIMFRGVSVINTPDGLAVSYPKIRVNGRIVNAISFSSYLEASLFESDVCWMVRQVFKIGQQD